VDRTRLPSPTLSTHFFRGGRAASVLSRLGVLEQALALGSPPLVCEYRYTNGRPSIEPPQQPGDVGYSLSVRRGPLDNLLVQRAIQTGRVELRQRCAVVGLRWQDDRVAGAELADEHGAECVRTRWVIGADGRRSFIARAVCSPFVESEAGHRAMYYRYVRGFLDPDGRAPHAAEFDLTGDELAYALPSDSGLTCIAVSMNLTEFAWLRRAPCDRFKALVARHAGLAQRVFASQPVGSVFGCGPSPNYVRVPFGRGWALVGDAGLHQDPWSGIGIDNAMVHATFLADALARTGLSPATERHALEEYQRQRDADALNAYQRTVVLSRDLRNLVQG
jgi:2-polyprenyl-6-methoxyphenol hydroxylase-like FAD-dependent oxidoreductase